MDIAKTLTELRKSKGLTRQELADSLKISVHTYIKYENGATKPPYETLLLFADFYGVTTDYIFGRELPPPPKNTLEILGIEKSVDDDEFIRLYEELPDYAKQIFVDTMMKLSQAATGENSRQRHVECLGDIEDRMKQEQEEEAKRKGVI